MRPGRNVSEDKVNGAAVMDPLSGAIGGSFGEGAGYASPRAESRTEDTVLVQALQAGSEDAFRPLIAQYSGPLFSLVLR